jgi:hypothetical protein
MSGGLEQTFTEFDSMVRWKMSLEVDEAFTMKSTRYSSATMQISIQIQSPRGMKKKNSASKLVFHLVNGWRV